MHFFIQLYVLTGPNFVDFSTSNFVVLTLYYICECFFCNDQVEVSLQLFLSLLSSIWAYVRPSHFSATYFGLDTVLTHGNTVLENFFAQSSTWMPSALCRICKINYCILECLYGLMDLVHLIQLLRPLKAVKITLWVTFFGGFRYDAVSERNIQWSTILLT